MPIAPLDRRLHSRIAFRAPAELVFANCTLDVAIIDLSLKGALVGLPTNAPIDAAAACVLRLRLDALDDEIRLDCRVAHVHAGLAGLVCLNIDLDSITHLRRIVELNVGDPQLLEREFSALISE